MSQNINQMNVITSNLKVNLQRYSQSCRPHGSGPFQDLPGTIPLFHHSNPEAVNGGTASGGVPTGIFLGTAGN